MEAHSVPVVVIPTAVGSLVVPSTTVCEVVSKLEIKPVPGGPEWLLGFCLWRNTPVSVVSFERLSGVDAIGLEIHRMVVMYPLPGRETHEYFAFASNGEPRGSTLSVDDSSGGVSPPPEMPRRFIAQAIRINHAPAAIPDFEALRAVFYG